MKQQSTTNHEVLVPDRISTTEISGPYALHVHIIPRHKTTLRICVGMVDADNRVFRIKNGRKGSPLYCGQSLPDALNFMQSHFNLDRHE